MQQFDPAKIVFRLVSIGAAVGLVFLLGLYSGARQNFAYDLVAGTKAAVEDAFGLVAQEATTLTGTRPDWFLQPAYYEGSGVTVDSVADDSLVMIAGFFEGGNQIRLIRRDGSIVAKWPVAFSALFPDTSHIHQPPQTDWNKDIHGTLLLPDGSVVFNFEQAGLVKLDRCGQTVWTVERETHHSVERAEAGGFWVPSRHFVEAGAGAPYPPFPPPYYEDTILRVSEDGRILSETSVVRLLYDNEMGPILTASGGAFAANAPWDREILHLNKVGELGSEMADDFPDFVAGDLVLSIRELNMVLVVDAGVEHVKWWKIGPWLRQHDPEFERGGRISVFDNGVFRDVFGTDNPYDRMPLTAPRLSRIVVIDPATDEYEVAYGARPGQEMLSVIRGKQQSTDRGGWLITEHNAGRVFETDGNGDTIWEYVNRYDEDEVAEITEARVYAGEYFDVRDWSCAAAD